MAESSRAVAAAAPKVTAPTRSAAGQRKPVRVGGTHDAFEREAERAANSVMSGRDPGALTLSRLSSVQRAALGDAGTRAVPESVDATLAEPGQALDSGTRSWLEGRFGRDFGGVRVSRSPTAARSARDLDARAYAVGNRIAFAAGEFAPETARGRHLLAHEVAHVVQQNGMGGGLIQRAPAGGGAVADVEPGKGGSGYQGGGGSSGGGGATSSLDDPADPATRTVAPTSDDKATATGAVGGRVTRIVIATQDGIIDIETPSMSYLYELDDWNIPQGRFSARISVHKDKTIVFTFDNQPPGQLFHFNYHINKGQDNPATLLKGQTAVDVEVVATSTVVPATHPVACLIPMSEKILIPRKTFKEPLFKPLKKTVDWHFAEIPLGFLGWIDANAQAGVSLAGLLSGGWDDGRLTEICLLRKLDRDRIAGSARFRFGAAISPSFNAVGKLKISADYLGAISLASIEGKLDASAIGRLTAALDSRVDLIYDRRKDKWSFEAEARLGGQAGMRLTATASAAIELLYKEVWSKSWKLVDADFHIGWRGGLRVGNDTKPHFEYGTLGVLAEGDQDPAATAGPTLPTAAAPDPLAVEANVDTPAMLQAGLNNDTGDPAVMPQGLSPDDALPLSWRKPLEIYMREIEIPRAISPATIERDAGPTPVNYAIGRGSDTVDIGVGEDAVTGQNNWPLPVARRGVRGKTFQFIEKTAGDTNKDWLRNTLNQRLRAPGPTLSESGFDVDHVQEKQFGGQDALPNLWPAQTAPNQAAGGQHRQQLDQYRATIPEGIVGRWFEIVEVRSP